MLRGGSAIAAGENLMPLTRLQSSLRPPRWRLAARAVRMALSLRGTIFEVLLPREIKSIVCRGKLPDSSIGGGLRPCNER